MKRYTNQIRHFLNREFIPVTKGLIVLTGGVFLLFHLLLLIKINLYNLLQLSTARFYLRPWTLLTYPLVNYNLLTLVFAMLWFWYIGGSLERSWGKQTYGFFLFLSTLATGLAFVLVSLLFRNKAMVIAGLWIPLTGITWAWAKLYPDREMLFWGLFPIKAEWLAWVQAGLTFYQYLVGYNILYALASISSIGVVYLFTGQGPFSRGFRYWAWERGFSFKGWRDKMKKRRLKVVK